MTKVLPLISELTWFACVLIRLCYLLWWASSTASPTTLPIAKHEQIGKKNVHKDVIRRDADVEAFQGLAHELSLQYTFTKKSRSIELHQFHAREVTLLNLFIILRYGDLWLYKWWFVHVALSFSLQVLSMSFLAYWHHLEWWLRCQKQW